MRRLVFTLLPALLFFQNLPAQQWKPAPCPLTTPWTEKVSPENALPEYPRPQMLRQNWMNLNGLWDFLLTDRQADKVDFNGKILVPYPVESALSGVGWKVEPKHLMVYRRVFTVPEGWRGQRVLLHFGASDWETQVFVNQKKAGEHRGGYDPFTFDITGFLNPGGGQQELSVQVSDPGNSGGQPVGKQHLQPHGIWYTGSSGIWQTVWLEPVAAQGYVRRFTLEPDLDRERLKVKVETAGEADDFKVVVKAFEAGKKLSESTGKIRTPHLLNIRSPHRWSPEDPFLYDLEITLEDASGKPVDKVRSYFAMRKISLGKDAQGVTRLMLNNEFVFQLGPLDQGFWPDGLYTPPTEDAMKFDLETLKSLGFNMIRKHVKVEPARWYHLCDRMGFLVWQDMPSARNESSEDRVQFMTELQAMVDGLFNHPCIVMWVPFNEGWGQHDTEHYVERIRAWDATRLVSNASGWTDMKCGDVMDIHDYPGPSAPTWEENRAAVLGEFGGLGLNVRGHQWAATGWGYDLIQSPEDLLARYEDLHRALLPLADTAGLSAAVYTQVSDVETENNGLLTYDRKVLKMDAALVALAHEGCQPPKPAGSARIFAGKTTVALATVKPGAEIFYTLDDSAPQEQWKRYTAPIPLKKPATLRCRAVWQDGAQSRPQGYRFEKVKAVRSKAPKRASPGIALKVFEGSWDSLPAFEGMLAAEQLTVSQLNLTQVGLEEDFALLFEGFAEVAETGAYTFSCSSDDGSRLFVAGQKLVENDGLHGMKEVSGSIALKKGRHPVRLEFFQKKGGRGGWRSGGKALAADGR